MVNIIHIVMKNYSKRPFRADDSTYKYIYSLRDTYYIDRLRYSRGH